MLSPWNISIISTDDDLGDLRSVVIEMIRSHGFKVTAFEEPDFPHTPGKHSHDVCLDALKKADIVILIIDDRYGGRYINDSSVSITEKEYNETLQAGKILLPCIREKIWSECHTLSLQIKDSKSKGKEFRLENKPGSLQNWELYDFIQRVTHATEDNYTIFYSKPNDLKVKILGKLKSLSDKIINEIVKQSIEDVKRLKTTTLLSLSIGDVIEKGYYTEPPFKIVSGQKNTDENLSNFILKVANEEQKKVAILGMAGIGKSTLIAKIYLMHAQLYINGTTNHAPLYIKLRGRGKDFHFDVNILINELTGQYLGKESFPLLDLSNLSFCIFMDSFDELSEELSSSDVYKIIDKSLFKSPFVIATRLDTVETLEIPEFADSVQVIIKLEKWSADLSRAYVEKFCASRGCNDLVEKIDIYFSDNEDLSNIFVNPLLLTLFLIVVEESKMKLPLDVSGKLSLYNHVIKVLAKRELVRKQGSRNLDEDINKVVMSWRLIAWDVYKSRYTNTNTNFNELIKLVCKQYNFKPTIPVCSAIRSIVDIRSYSDIVFGFVHEELLEYLCAVFLVNGMQNEDYPFPDSLKYPVRSEINKFIVEQIRVSTEFEKNNLLDALYRQYLSALKCNDTEMIILRNQAAYYMGRLENDVANIKLIELERLESNITVKLSLYFGLVKNGDLDKEDILFESLTSNIEWDRANRGYHLFYYQDWQAPRGHNFHDPENVCWGRTFKALLSHLLSESLRHLYLSRIELFTIKRFIETRKNVGSLSEENLKLIEGKIEKSKSVLPLLFYNKVYLMLTSLRIAWNSYNTGSESAPN